MAEFEVERVGGELRRFGVSGSPAPFEVVSPFEPSGDQPQAIASLVQGVRDGDRYQVLLGVTGSGKTFTMAKLSLIHIYTAKRRNKWRHHLEGVSSDVLFKNSCVRSDLVRPRSTFP